MRVTVPDADTVNVEVTVRVELVVGVTDGVGDVDGISISHMYLNGVALSSSFKRFESTCDTTLPSVTVPKFSVCVSEPEG